MENQENISVYNAESVNLSVGEHPITHVVSVDLDENKKQKGIQRCQITNVKSRLLFRITKEDESTIDVKASVLREAGLTQKQVDKLYGISWKAEHPNEGGNGVSKEEVKEAVAALLA